MLDYTKGNVQNLALIRYLFGENRKQKLDHYQDGVCYLTSHRVIYVDNTNPLEYSVEISLSIIKDVESYVKYCKVDTRLNN
jgi:ESCRT-II complex subunit VPS36